MTRLAVMQPDRFFPSILSDFDRTLENFWGLENSDARKNAFFAAESVETDQAYRLTFDIPGVKKEDIKIEFKDRTLTLSGERKRAETKETDRQTLRERVYGTFSRSFVLPEGVDAENIQAAYQDGVLEVTIPKAPEVKPRAIQIN